MRLALASVALLSCAAPTAGPGDELWTRRVGDGFGLDVAVDGARVVAVGVRETAAQRDDAWVIVLDHDGHELWSRDLDRGGDELAAGVAIDGDATVIAGATRADASWDAWIVRLQDGGATAWEQTIAGAAGGEDQAVAIAIAPDGSLVAVGYSTADDGGTAAWIAGFAADGASTWAQLHEGPGIGFDVATGVAWSLADDVAWVVGYETSARGDTDVWVSTWRVDGTMELTAAIDVEGGDDRATAVAQTPGGGAWVSGVATVPGRTVDAWATELDASGTPVWSMLHDGPTSLGDGANGCAGTDETVLVAGYEYVDGEAWNTWARGLDRTGSELWTHRWRASEGDDVAADVAIEPGADDGDAAGYLVGSTTVASERREAYVRKLAL